MKVLVFAGAGCSVELGVPAMRKMVLELLTHMETVVRDDEMLAMLRDRIKNTNADLESVIEDIDTICDAQTVLPSYGGEVAAELVESARLTRGEIEWFVQHMCEGVRADYAVSLWGPLVQTTDGAELTIGTTNYDRGVELACQRLGVKLADGFADFGDMEWASWEGYEDQASKLLKLHGSTDWYQVRSSTTVVKLRHPMPLFGGVTLQLETYGLGALGSALVLPSREKRKSNPPFPQISHELFSAAKAADVAIFVGTSLRDPDLRSVVEECALRIPTILVSPELTHGDGVVPAKVALVHDYASGFLVSTLPGMVAAQEFPTPGSDIAPVGGTTPASILEDVVCLTDPTRSEDAKCGSIETLWRQSVSLGRADISPLLKAAAGEVARDALALVPLSRDSVDLMAECKELAKSSGDPGFREDVDLLARMVHGTDMNPAEQG